MDNNLPVNCVNTWENNTLATDNQGNSPERGHPDMLVFWRARSVVYATRPIFSRRVK